MSEKWVCIHGHFYQPPRENPWLETVEPQPSAKPYRDWNERITAECYRPNAAARVVNNDGQIINIVDNYERMSFDVGPTLMSWLEEHASDVHGALVEADRASMARFSGHGSAMAQVYNHVIMPLATARDQATQVRWGITDFVYRYGRKPEGMWLAECAADTASLEALAAEGIVFTVLAPHQAAAWRAPAGEWQTGPIETGRVYRCPLPSGRAIDLYFYDGSTAQAVAFERLLANGAQYVSRVLGRGAIEGGGPTLCHIATDGETYGHHHRHGDMALAWALARLEAGVGGARLTNYGEFRALVPATWEVKLAEATSWSCAHGVARWRDDCGCHTGGRDGWNQRWRRPLRDSLEWLRGQCEVVLERVGAALFHDVWAARDEYGAVVVARTAEARERFLAAHARHPLAEADRVRALSLMEMARHAMLMFTSCGWFFDELSGIETVQCLQYAARAMELAEAADGEEGGQRGAIETAFVERLAAARSNLSEEGDGRSVWTRRVQPARVDLTAVAAHAAVQTLVEPGADTEFAVFGYDVKLLGRIEQRAGRARMVAGTVSVRSRLTEVATSLCFAGLHLGEQHVTGGLRARPGAAEWSDIVAELTTALQTADVFAAQRAIDKHFSGAELSLGSLLPGTRERVIEFLLAEPIARANADLAKSYDDHAPLIRWLVAHAMPVPDALHVIAAAALRGRVLGHLTDARASFALLQRDLEEAAAVKISLDDPEVALAASVGLRRLLAGVATPDGELDPAALDTIASAAEVAARMKSPVDLWFAQNAAWRLLERLPALRLRGAAGDASALAIASTLVTLASALRLAVPQS